MRGGGAVTVDDGGDTVFSEVHPDIIKSHVLTRLDGPTLGAAACCSTTIRRLSSDDGLWSNVCHSTWPSTSQFVDTFGPRSFFSHAYPIPITDHLRSPSEPPPPEIISAVDIHYKDKLIFTKAQETETLSGWFRCSPFRIDLLDPKDAVVTPIKGHDNICTDIIDNMTLSWVLIDMVGRRVVNLSSHKPVRVQRHWLTREVQARYASIHGHVQCEIVVTCGGGGGEDEMMHVKEVCLQMEDMDGMHLNGKDSLVFLQRALEAKRRSGNNRAQLGQRRYKEYVEMKKQRSERKLRAEGALDTLCVTFGVSIFALFCSFLLCTLHYRS